MRALMARHFTNHFILALILISGVGPVLFHWNVGGHVGLAMGLLGSILVFISSRRAMRLTSARDEK